jgi:hypothetical protein
MGNSFTFGKNLSPDSRLFGFFVNRAGTRGVTKTLFSVLSARQLQFPGTPALQ